MPLMDAYLACLSSRGNPNALRNRFHIEDLICQDATGVVFRALDSQTGAFVALRRFFPFGANGGGLEPEEVTAYKIAIERLSGLKHPALRSVITGGCDPEDGMPYIVTEWLDGDPLDAIVRHEPLPAPVAARVLALALEVSELLSQVLAEEAVWVETDLQSIILGSEASGRGFTFWISPFKWLGGAEQARGLHSIAALAEESLGWRGQVIGDQAGGGLGAWLKWLRGAADTASLREARETLAAALGKEPPPPPPPRKPVPAIIKPAPPRKSKTPLLLICGCTLIASGVGGWLVMRYRAPRNLQSELPAKIPEETKPEVVTANEMIPAGQGGVFTPADGALLALRKGDEVVLEGKVLRSDFSRSQKTLYLYFLEMPQATEPRGAIRFTGADAAYAEKLRGKNVRLKGKVMVRDQRPEILVTDPKAVHVIE
jgi:hypothetical protein